MTSNTEATKSEGAEWERAAEKEVREIAEYLGCNDGELWSEMSQLLAHQRQQAVAEFAREVVAIAGRPRHYCNCDECHGGEEYIATSRIRTIAEKHNIQL